MKNFLLLTVIAFALAACHSPSGTTPVSPVQATLAIGVSAAQQHAYRLAPQSGIINTDPVATASSGSVILTMIGRGTWSASPNATGDSYHNTFQLSGQTHAYQAWPESQTGLYVKTAAAGGSNHSFTASFGAVGSQSTDGDEVSLSVVEIKNGAKVQDVSFVEKTLPGGSTTLTSNAVTTTGPAILVAWWWGTAGIPPVGQNHVATPEASFTLLPDATRTIRLHSNGYVQFAAAYRKVSIAGTYTVTWTTTEGAQLYLVAVQ